MNMEIKKFYNSEMNFTVNTFIDKSGNPWFKAKEIATLLSYKKPRSAIKRHVDEEDKKWTRGPVRQASGPLVHFFE